MSEESKPEASKKGKGKARSGEGEMSNISNISRELVEQLLRANPSLAGEMQGMDSKKIEEVMRGMSLQDISTGMATGGKNQKDMASYKFWNTQPVPKFGEDEPLPDGPLRENDLARVKTVGAELIEGFEWDTVDLTDDQQVFFLFLLRLVW
jgi:glycylpeptide N-tetradecanoyltransferase